MSDTYNPTSHLRSPQTHTTDVPNLQQQHQSPQHAHLANNGNLLATPTPTTIVNYIGTEASSLNPPALLGNHAITYEHTPIQLSQSGNGLEEAFYTSPPHGITSSTTANRYFTTATTTTAPANTILITNTYGQQAAVQQQQQQQQHGNAILNGSSIQLFAAPGSANPTAAATTGDQQHLIIDNNNHAIITKDGQDVGSTTTTAIPLHQLWQQQQQQQQLANLHPQHSAGQMAQTFTLSQATPPTHQQQQFLQQPQQQQQHLTSPTHHHQHTTMQLQLAHTSASPHTQHFYVTTGGSGQSQANPAAIAIAPSMVTTTTTSQSLANASLMLPSVAAATTTTAMAQRAVAPTATAGGTSTVVLDRINICINNHYTDSAAMGGGGIGSPVAALSSSSTSESVSQPQSSPIIPAIHHKPVLDNGNALMLDAASAYASAPQESQESLIIVLDEPDSTTTTTTPHTPPTTPENIPSPTPSVSTASSSTGPTTTETDSSNRPMSIDHDNDDHDEYEAEVTEKTKPESIQIDDDDEDDVDVELPIAPKQKPQSSPITPPKSTATSPSAVNFSMGEDVFVKRQDGRLYLGTVIRRHAHEHYLVRFDDKSELWCKADEMRKLGVGNAAENSTDAGPMCVSCKRSQINDVVEICERCGRGYHRKCTTETAAGNGEWLCKRCAKPMKVQKVAATTNPKQQPQSVCRQLPYCVESLTWDDKHRVNAEHIYCYCGQAGQFDQMLQCCKCLNWYHTHCMQNFKTELLRGDGFFVFCCTVCNDGVEFLRRLQMSWVDIVHLALYNLSDRLKPRSCKYHHLVKDIWPFIMAKRKMMAIPKEWILMPERDFMDHVKVTLKEHRDQFICGREAKRDHNFYGLRNVGPPILPVFKVQKTDVLTDEFITKTLKLNLLKGAVENTRAKTQKRGSSFMYDGVGDTIDLVGDDDEKFTSDDEIPIKQIIEKSKKDQTTPTKKQPINVNHRDTSSSTTTSSSSLCCHSPKSSHPMKKPCYDLDDECANDAKSDLPLTPSKHAAAAMPLATTQTQIEEAPIGLQPPPAKTGTNRRKLTAYAKPKLYFQPVVATPGSGPNRGARWLDSSSDENSSSSRSSLTLDFLIPRPKNFLGQNNPFLMVSPKKTQTAARDTSLKNSHTYTGSQLDFGTKLAALKSGGMHTSNLGGSKAAGQPRTVRTIKRRLSAKDITIGPNQEVRRRRTRPQSSNIEVINTTTFNPIPSKFVSKNAKDSHTTSNSSKFAEMANTMHQFFNGAASTVTTSSLGRKTTVTTTSTCSSTSSSSSCSTAAFCSCSSSSIVESTVVQEQTTTSTHGGRRLRQRPQKPNTSSRNSSTSTNKTSKAANTTVSTPDVASTSAAAAAALSAGAIAFPQMKCNQTSSWQDANRVFQERESGASYKIWGRRLLNTGQLQYLVGSPSVKEDDDDGWVTDEDDDEDGDGDDDAKDLKAATKILAAPQYTEEDTVQMQDATKKENEKKPKVENLKEDVDMIDESLKHVKSQPDDKQQLENRMELEVNNDVSAKEINSKFIQMKVDSDGKSKENEHQQQQQQQNNNVETSSSDEVKVKKLPAIKDVVSNDVASPAAAATNVSPTTTLPTRATTASPTCNHNMDVDAVEQVKQTPEEEALQINDTSTGSPSITSSTDDVVQNDKNPGDDDSTNSTQISNKAD